MRIHGGLVLGLALSACGSSTTPANPDASPPPPDAVTYPAFPVAAPQIVSKGGPVLASPRLVSVSFNDATDAAQMDALVAGLAASAWWHVVAEYGVGAVTSTKAVHLPDPAPMTIDDAAIQTWLAGELANDPTDFGDPTGTLYVIFYPSATTTITVRGETVCNQIGAYHADAALTGGGHVAYAVIPVCSKGFNGYNGVDLRSMLTSHEIAEGVTDPYPSSAPAWQTLDADDQVWASWGAEVGDMCLDQATGKTADVTPADLPFKVTRVWSNAAAAAGHDPCQPTSATYFDVYPELPTIEMLTDASGGKVPNHGIHIVEGASATVTLDLFSDAATGPWSVSATDLATLKGLPAKLQFSFDRTIGTNGDKLHMTIKVLSTNTAQGGEIFWVKASQGGVGSVVTHDWLGVVGG